MTKVIERFESKIFYSPDGCWYWTGAQLEGYGKLTINGKPIGAHRYSYQINKGEIKAGLLVCHSCDNPLCVNPDHLFLGTIQDNMDDRNEKNRQAKGERNHSKLTEEQVEKIRWFYNRGRSTRSIAKMFSIGKTTAHKIATNQSWSYLPPAPKYRNRHSTTAKGN